MAYDYDRRSRVAGNNLSEKELSSVEGQAYQFFLRAEQHWTGASYSSSSQTGKVKWPGLGMVTFREAQSGDTAVIVNVEGPIYMKARPKDVMKTLEKIAKLVGNTAL